MSDRYEAVYFPFAKVITANKYLKYFLLYNATTGKVEAFTRKAIVEERNDGRDIRGFNKISNYLDTLRLFSPLPVMGEKSEKEYRLAFRKILNKDGYFLETIDLSGNRKMFNKEQALYYLKSGNVMLGVKLKTENDKLFVSQDLLLSYPMQGGKIHTASSLQENRKVVDISEIEDEDE